MHRIARLCLACSLLLALAPSADADFDSVFFIDGPATVDSPGSVTFGADGSLSMTGPVSMVRGDVPGGSFPITDGSFVLTLGKPDSPFGGGFRTYLAGGSITITGEVPGGQGVETLLSATIGSFEMGPPIGGVYEIGANQAYTFFDNVSPLLIADAGYHSPTEVFSDYITFAFRGTPGGPSSLLGMNASFIALPVPEPSSGLLLTLGLMGFGLRRMRRRVAPRQSAQIF